MYLRLVLVTCQAMCDINDTPFLLQIFAWKCILDTRDTELYPAVSKKYGVENTFMKKGES